jgi:hypothetical protein
MVLHVVIVATLPDPHSVERDMLDELLGPSSARSASSRPGRASTGTLHDMELMTAMADRLGKAEAAARVLRLVAMLIHWVLLGVVSSAVIGDTERPWWKKTKRY